MKTVLDTTILVRANEHAHGLARELLTCLIESEHVLLLSNEMLHELAKVLRYPRLRAFYALTEELIYNYVELLRQSAEVITLNPLLTAPIRDVTDMIVVQTAIIGEAEVLCTTDADFFEPRITQYLGSYGVSVLDDIALMERLRF